MNKLCGWSWAVILIFCCIGTSGYADEQQNVRLETIMVTAQKREENMQEIPVSISSFSDEALYDAGIDELSEIARFSSNVHIKQNSIVIRGVSQYYGAKVSAVGFYLDGVSLPFEGLFSSELFDIERIEVLKGPQGTLYGRNSESGVINIITKQPGNDFSGKLYGEYGLYDTEFGTSPSYHAGGSINGPIVKDKLLLRLSGKWKDDSGYMKNVYNGDEEAGKDTNYNGRLNLKWIPHDRWDISLIADAMSKDWGTAYTRYVTGDNDEGRHRISYDGPYSGEKNGDGQTLRINYSGDEYNLLSITGRRKAKENSEYDFDLTSIPSWASESYIVDENTCYSQEIRLSSARKMNPFQWLAGVYGFDEEMNIYQQKVFPRSTTTRDTNTDSFGYAIFGQGTYTFIEKLHLTAGLRYDYTEFEGDQHLTTSAGETVYGKDFDNGEILPKLSVAYDFSDNTMAYTTAARGYLTGGYNFKWATDADNLTYDPEYTWNYEIGMKSSWLNKRLIANVAAFYIDMKDKQVTEWDPASGYIKLIRNAANAYSTGVEFDLQARPAPGFDLFAGVGYTRAKIDDWVAWEYDSTTGETYQYDYSDKLLPNVPEYTYNLGVQYRHLSGFFGRVDWQGIGPLYSDTKNSAKENGYQLVNLRLGFESEKYDIQVWCKNLFDEEYLQVRFASADEHTGVDGQPRMFGVTMTYRF
jgi:iron complex outermembrane receptor protein